MGVGDVVAVVGGGGDTVVGVGLVENDLEMKMRRSCCDTNEILICHSNGYHWY